jgi:hypothetical protein
MCLEDAACDQLIRAAELHVDMIEDLALRIERSLDTSTYKYLSQNFWIFGFQPDIEAAQKLLITLTPARSHINPHLVNLLNAGITPRIRVTDPGVNWTPINANWQQHAGPTLHALLLCHHILKTTLHVIRIREADAQTELVIPSLIRALYIPEP